MCFANVNIVKMYFCEKLHDMQIFLFILFDAKLNIMRKTSEVASLFVIFCKLYFLY